LPKIDFCYNNNGVIVVMILVLDRYQCEGCDFWH